MDISMDVDYLCGRGSQDCLYGRGSQWMCGLSYLDGSWTLIGSVFLWLTLVITLFPGYFRFFEDQIDIFDGIGVYR